MGKKPICTECCKIPKGWGHELEIVNRYYQRGGANLPPLNCNKNKPLILGLFARSRSRQELGRTLTKQLYLP